MTTRMIFAGFGGQGVMLMGQIISLASMIEGKNVTWMPSYGPEMRGGTANCTVVVSDEPVASPVTDKAEVVVAMNIPSLLKFEPYVVENGYLFLNQSVIDRESKRNDINVLKIPCNEIADEIGNLKVANMVMLGAVVGATNVVSTESIFKAIEKKLSGGKTALIEVNKQAIMRGYELAKK
ncbi:MULTISPECIES: 2-oxoacid:acceptor oxidoreductase family protein [Fervidobacterium]|uniref:Pyruvate/ketoisovalerate oxidoreductase, gamma subunit n=1 Tax=Fervidobacterium nodosum (strain ATCC 35602 / DSM 5306 / Rt17-B1) TaxID=381764 RepID=A7HJ97_FERNB|nr:MULTISPECIES: 2-oxoacid:acceptor oxidoreductase family protein [Fervidobacterium]ABS59980.1 pyruvate/ketoisovalerate oxidoreductase, gamma subunit [Fervidobacterium nodosum Rt17-B1]KAF2961657.1 2-oxoacid:ferredoxin oxidoreductase subunit gamma [Fervidobacterium sp. 2310opik-2]PHJ14487.1 2-oxoacid:ferredoxin oxidoreductase subunit gamma [Fervidobacterium sp. SC_NGM5_G05]